VAAIAILLAILIVAALIVYFVKPTLFIKIINYTYGVYLEDTQPYYYDTNQDDSDTYTAPSATLPTSGTLGDIQSADLSIHFLELGNKYAGDCTLIKVGETEVLIDAGSRTSSATTINSYLSEYVDGEIEYVIATHAHQDHLAAFYGKKSGSTMNGVLYQNRVGTIITYANHNSTSTVVSNFETATQKATNAQGEAAKVYTALECYNNQNGAQRTYQLSDSVTLNVLYNYYYENTTSDENDYSVCVLLTQTLQDGTQNNYLFTGDLEGDGESYLVDNNNLPQCVLFKGAHHGSKTSSTDKLLSVIKPQNVAVCCCTGSTEYTTNNDNTFPTQAFISRVGMYTKNIYCTSIATSNGFTSLNGNIVFYYGTSETDTTKQVRLYCSNNATILKETEWFQKNRTWPTGGVA
jgi:competence protein ComEC